MAYVSGRKCYVVTFEVASQSALTSLKDRLKAYGAYCPIHGSAWGILSEQTAAQIRDYLSEALQATDRLFIIRSGTEAAWRNAYGAQYNEWLKKNL